MTVIGYKETPQQRLLQWNDLLESKKSVRMFRNSNDEQSRMIAACDQDFFARNLSKYVA